MREPNGIDGDSDAIERAFKRGVGREETKSGTGATAPEAGNSTLGSPREAPANLIESGV